MNSRDIRPHSISNSSTTLFKDILSTQPANFDDHFYQPNNSMISPTSQVYPQQSFTTVSSPLDYMFRGRDIDHNDLKLPSLTPLPRMEAEQTTLPSLVEVLNDVMAPTQPSYHTQYMRFDRPMYTMSHTPHHSNSKRPRRKFHEVRRIYSCSYYGCTKAYGALNHLNSHILTQGHGRRRRACEFHHITRQ